ncbi:unnamed protein product [Dovyalis caffra]|uniref:Uncharacterized protein n=1 Tax=Dovyalis caffra TaxID=77055 RepID=A0AAV1SML7_9ROSI|nr:unnamed protein product [Dovyalis caffra]
MVVFCGPTGNKFLFSNENKLVNLWWPTSVKKLLKSSVVNVVGDEVKRMRKILLTSVDPDALKSIDDLVHISKLANQFDVFLRGVIHFPVNILGTRFYHASKATDAIKEELRLIARHKRTALDQKIRLEMKVDHNDPRVPYGRALAQWIKVLHYSYEKESLSLKLRLGKASSPGPVVALDSLSLDLSFDQGIFKCVSVSSNQSAFKLSKGSYQTSQASSTVHHSS